jgi:hypothetical protein
VPDSRYHRSSSAEKRIEDPIVLSRKRQHEAFDQLYGELAGVPGLLHMVALYVRDNPHVARVLAEWVA